MHVRDLSFCSRPLELECQKLETHDERFITVADLAQSGRYTEAGDAVAALLAEQLYDVRLVGYALFASFHEEGPRQLKELLRQTVAFLKANLPTSAAPADNADPRVPVFDRALTWLFRSLADALEYQHAQKAEPWTTWVAGLTRPELALVVTTVRELSALLPSPAFQSSGAHLTRLLQLCRGLEPSVALTSPVQPMTAAQEHGGNTGGAGHAAPSATSHPATTTPVLDENAAHPAGFSASSSAPAQSGLPRHVSVLPSPAAPVGGMNGPAATTEQLGRGATHATPGAVVQLRATARFLELCSKLQAFEALVKRGDFDKAAIVSSDIMRTIESFDPRAFFPDLFAGFGALLSAHIHDIGPRWDGKDSLEWRALEQYYQVDLESFVGREP